jgi:carboxyl-terminal processing protease
MRMNYRPRRLRSTLLLYPAFVAGLAIGAVSDMVAKHFLVAFGNTALAQDTDRTNTYRLLTVFGDVFQRVCSEYVDPVSDTYLINNAINGMLTGLDPHSSSMSAAQFRAMQEETKGELAVANAMALARNGVTAN